ncbi:MAG: MerR family DNA-binding transcriptional regulator [Actinobacteria bacterium]|nr:MerR family DNA-binding transcriptional regulator [Actinomycetota bacterium]
MGVGAVADLTGTTVRTLQYYDRIGLLVARRLPTGPRGHDQAPSYTTLLDSTRNGPRGSPRFSAGGVRDQRLRDQRSRAAISRTKRSHGRRSRRRWRVACSRVAPPAADHIA